MTQPSHRSILAFGDSLTAGYGLPSSESFAAQLERALCDDGAEVRVHNAGVSGNTSWDGVVRLPRVLSTLKAKPDLTILALGANDMLRLVDPARTRANLEAMLDELTRLEFPVLLAGMKTPIFFDAGYREAFESIFPDLAARYGVPLYPFFLEGIVMNPALNLPDHLHPNARGVAVMVRGILPLVKQALGPVTA
jgi:acyl-CoA thioesterase-1